VNAEEARALLAAGPGERLATLPGRVSLQRLGQTLAALANSSGGAAVLSMREADPLDHDALADRAVEAALSCDPALIVPLPEFLLVDGQTYLALTVPPGLPHVYAHGGTYWRRDGTSNVALGARELRALILSRSSPSLEALPVPGGTRSAPTPAPSPPVLTSRPQTCSGGAAGLTRVGRRPMPASSSLGASLSASCPPPRSCSSAIPARPWATSS
jgi:hypothetical protein